MADIGGGVLNKGLKNFDFEHVRIAIIKTIWNADITDELTNGAIRVLKDYGVKDIPLLEVPGAAELPFAIQRYDQNFAADAIIAFGCVVRGDTPHFEYVCNLVTNGITDLNAVNDAPIIFGVLTVDNKQQALDRIGGSAGHKGEEAALTALQMVRYCDWVDENSEMSLDDFSDLSLDDIEGFDDFEDDDEEDDISSKN